MRVRLDNCVPWRLSRYIEGHDVTSVITLGWADWNDGALLNAMAGMFDVLVTVDKSILYQQNLHGRPLAVVLLCAKSNKLGDLVPLMPQLLKALKDIAPGAVVDIHST